MLGKFYIDQFIVYCLEFILIDNKCLTKCICNLRKKETHKGLQYIGYNLLTANCLLTNF